MNRWNKIGRSGSGAAAAFFRLLAAVAIWFFPVLALAELQFDVFIGVDGCARESAWFPIVCEVRNDSAAFTGMIEVQPVFQPLSDTRRLTLELPTGTLKRVLLPVFARDRGTQSWNIRLLDQAGQVRAERLDVRLRQQVSARSVLLGSISRTSRGAPAPRAAKRSSPLQVAVGEIQPPIFPDNPLVLQGMTALYLNSERAAELKPPQAEAISAWVRGGGHLVVGIENASDVSAAPWLAALVPCTVLGQRMLERHPEPQEWLRSPAWPDLSGVSSPEFNPDRRDKGENPFAELAPDDQFEASPLPVATVGSVRGHVVLGAGGAPLVISSGCGKGLVSVLLFSPERQPARAWKNLDVFWARLVNVPASAYLEAGQSYSAGWSTDAIFGALIETRQVRKMPLGWLMLLLAVYLVVIGPLDRFWLKRINRPMLTWITFPGYVVLFSVMIYFIGYKLRAGDSEYSELHVVDIVKAGGGEELHGQTYAALYSPENQDYLVAATNRLAALRNETQAGWAGGSARERTDILLQGDGFSASVRVPVWSSRLLVSQWLIRDPAPLTGTVAVAGDGWIVAVENRSSRLLKGARLVSGGRVHELGDLGPKQTLRTNLSSRRGITLEGFVKDHSGDFQNAVRYRNRSFGGRGDGDTIQHTMEASMACSFLSKMAGGDKYGGRFVATSGLDLTAQAEDPDKAVLLVWEEGPGPVPSMNRFDPARGRRNTLWRQIIQVQSAAGQSPEAQAALSKTAE